MAHQSNSLHMFYFYSLSEERMSYNTNLAHKYTTEDTSERLKVFLYSVELLDKYKVKRSLCVYSVALSAEK